MATELLPNKEMKWHHLVENHEKLYIHISFYDIFVAHHHGGLRYRMNVLVCSKVNVNLLNLYKYLGVAKEEWKRSECTKGVIHQIGKGMMTRVKVNLLHCFRRL